MSAVVDDGPSAGGVWVELVGQQEVVGLLQLAAHAAVGALATSDSEVATPPRGNTSWLFTGPAGSGRSIAARAFAAALECEHAGQGQATDVGCGQCAGCQRVLGRSSPDMQVVSTQTLTHSVADVRRLVAAAARQPSMGRWQIILIEDADRLTEQAANALLKALEEPAAGTWWLLCAPSAQDVLPTVRSRCQMVVLRTPTTEQVAQVLIARDQVEPVIAYLAARAADGHVGRARWLAVDSEARQRHAASWTIPLRIDTVSQCLQTAAQVVQGASEQAQEQGQQMAADQREQLSQALGVPQQGQRGVSVPRSARAALREQDKRDKARQKRMQRDAIDQVLVQLTRCYRDVLAYQWGAQVGVMRQVSVTGCGEDQDPASLGEQIRAAESGLRSTVEQVAACSTPSQTLNRLNAIVAAREAMQTHVAPLLALEVLMLHLSPGCWLRQWQAQKALLSADDVSGALVVGV